MKYRKFCTAQCLICNEDAENNSFCQQTCSIHFIYDIFYRKGNATPIVQWIEAHHNPRATKRHPTEYVEIMSFGFGQDIFSISKPNTKYPIHENPKSNMKNLINKFINFWMIKGWGPRFQRIHILHVLTYDFNLFTPLIYHNFVHR